MKPAPTLVFLTCSVIHGKGKQICIENLWQSLCPERQMSSKSIHVAPSSKSNRNLMVNNELSSLRLFAVGLLAFRPTWGFIGSGLGSRFLSCKASAWNRCHSQRSVVKATGINYMQSPRPSPWPSIRKRAAALFAEVYAESVAEVVMLVHRMLPPATPGIPSLRARLGNMGLACIAVFVAFVGRLEKLITRATGLPVHMIREATLDEISQGVGRLASRGLLPSAYEVWLGSRSEGRLALRYTYDKSRLQALLALTPKASRCVCEPLVLDSETMEWVRSHVMHPASASRVQVWRALKRRMYHYDAGVVAFRDYPRNYLLSSNQWLDLLDHPQWTGTGIALDIGAGDGSLNLPMRNLFARIVATELTTPLVLRLRSMGLEGVLAEEPCVQWLGESEFDVVLILNVLDRCKDPFKILRQARALLRPGGKLVVSVVVPVLQTDAASGTGGSQQQWYVAGSTFEMAAASLVQHVLMPAGFEPLRIIRAPYFCAGDHNSPVAALDACVAVLQAVESNNV